MNFINTGKATSVVICLLCLIRSAFSLICCGKTSAIQQSKIMRFSPRTNHIRVIMMASTNAASDSLFFEPTVSLTSIAVQKAMNAAEKEATENGWKVTIAIADSGGVPLLVKRCDDAFSASYEVAVGKAKTAAQFCKPTGALEDATNVSDGKSRTALLSAPFVLMRGGVPIMINGKCCGSVGVSGVRPNEDEQVAMAAVNALSSAISKL